MLLWRFLQFGICFGKTIMVPWQHGRLRRGDTIWVAFDSTSEEAELTELEASSDSEEEMEPSVTVPLGEAKTSMQWLILSQAWTTALRDRILIRSLVEPAEVRSKISQQFTHGACSAAAVLRWPDGTIRYRFKVIELPLSGIGFVEPVGKAAKASFVKKLQSLAVRQKRSLAKAAGETPSKRHRI